MRRARELLDRLFGVDARSLAAFRISIGVLLLADLAWRVQDLEAHYTDLGVLPRQALTGYFALSDWYWSIHLVTGSSLGQSVLFGVAAVAAIAMVFGYGTRWATVVSWVLLVSLQARNPTILYGADQLLRVLLFWAMFLPLGTLWSIEGFRLGEDVTRPARHLSMASAGIFLQVFVMYFFVGVQKEGAAWHSGQALANVLSAETYAGPLAEVLLAYPALLEVAGRLVPWFEMLVPLLLFVPVATQVFRLVGLLVLAGFHILLALCLATGFFPAVSLAALLVFVPSRFWDSPIWEPMRRWLRALGKRASFAPRQVSESLGTAVAKHGGLNTVVQIFLGLVLIYVVVWNVAGLGIDGYTRERSLGWFEEWRASGREGYPASFRDYSVERRLGGWGAPGRILHLHQRWDMFSTAGPQTHGWPAVVATTRDGSVLSLLEEGRVLAGGPGAQSAQAGVPDLDARWRMYFTFTRFTATRPLRELLPGMLQRHWNDDHPERAVDAPRLLFVQELPGSSAISGGRWPR